MNEKIIEWIENAQNIVADELPSFIQEVVVFGFWSNVMKAIVWIIILIFFLFCAKKLWNYGISQKDCHREESEAAFMIAFALVIISMLPLFFVVGSVELSIKAAFAPKLYVIERFIEK